jgi:hypothetical protein
MGKTIRNEVVLGRITDVFFDTCLYLCALISIFMVFINPTHLQSLVLYISILVCVLSLIFAVLITTKKLDKRYLKKILASPESDDLLTISDKILPFSNKSLLRSKVIRWGIYIRKPETKYFGDLKIRNKILVDIGKHINLIDRIIYYMFIVSGFITCLLLIANLFL